MEIEVAISGAQVCNQSPMRARVQCLIVSDLGVWRERNLTALRGSATLKQTCWSTAKANTDTNNNNNNDNDDDDDNDSNKNDNDNNSKDNNNSDKENSKNDNDNHSKDSDKDNSKNDNTSKNDSNSKHNDNDNNHQLNPNAGPSGGLRPSVRGWKANCPHLAAASVCHYCR